MSSWLSKNCNFHSRFLTSVDLVTKQRAIVSACFTVTVCSVITITIYDYYGVVVRGILPQNTVCKNLL